MAVVTKRATVRPQKRHPRTNAPRTLGLSFRDNLNQTGIAVHILVPTAVGAVECSGSGRTPLQSLVIFNLLHAVVLECLSALGPIVHGWCMRRGGGAKSRRSRVIRQPRQTSQQLDEGALNKK